MLVKAMVVRVTPTTTVEGIPARSTVMACEMVPGAEPTVPDGLAEGVPEPVVVEVGELVEDVVGVPLGCTTPAKATTLDIKSVTLA